MNIEELFENEKWPGYLIVVPRRDVNQSIDYLKEEVMEYVEGLQKRITELEQVLRWLDTQGGLGYEKHAEIKKVLGGDA